jgi:chromosome segregation ATPase
MAATSFDLATHWPPLADSFAEMQAGWETLGHCADSVLGEVDAIRQELAERARELDRLQDELALREAQLSDQKADFAQFSLQFEQQARQLAETATEVALLREAVQQQPAPAGGDKEVFDLITMQLDELRDLLGRTQQPPAATASAAAESEPGSQADPIVNSLFAEFAKAQRDSVRLRAKGA